MKRIIILIFVLLALHATAALGEGNRLIELEEDYINDLLTDGDALYILGEGQVYVWRPGDDAPSGLDIEPLYNGEEEGSYYGVVLLAGESGLKALRIAWDETGTIYDLALCDVALGDDGQAQARNIQSLGQPDVLRSTGYFDPRGACLNGKGLAILGDGESGAQLLLLDPEAPRDARLVDLPNWDYTLVPSAQGALLLDRSFEEKNTLLKLGADGEPEPLCQLTGSVIAVAADPDTGAIYAASQGRVYPVSVPDGTPGEAFGAVPLEPRRAVVLKNGQGCAVAMDGAVAVLDPTAKLAEDQLLRISNDYTVSWVNRATLQYTVEHPEAPPVTIWSSDRVLEDMLTRSPDTDVYIMDAVRGGAYDALLDRGYMLPLGDSPTLSSLAGRMYPGMRDRLCRDGAPVALPLRLSGSGMGIGEGALAKLGLKLEDVPTDWPGFLDFLEQTVKPRLDMLGEERFTYEMTAGAFARALREHILTGYVYTSDAAGRLPDYADARLLALLKRVEEIDFTEYGLPEISDDGDDFGYSYDNGEYLISLDLAYGFEDTDSTSGTPLLLGFGDDLPGVMPVDMTVAFVNPFSPRAEAATAFLEALAARLPEQALYGLCPDLNEPLRDPNADETLAQLQQGIDQTQAQLDAAEPVDRPLLEEALENQKQNKASYEAEGAWLISADALTKYRANADRMYVERPTWFDKDGTGEAYDLLSQYEAGAITLEKFLTEVDRKARMQALEG
ncbi:MAG: hypothetical protein IJ119_09695 [Clostridia bacterium]|nr:hypothetical protein [Clostridia bacterium]